MGSKKDCIFCKIAKGEMKSEKIRESDNFFAIRDVNPEAEGHALVIPKKHFGTILDVPDKLGVEMLKMVKEVGSKLLDDKLGDGFNVLQNNLGVAGQVVIHAHLHVIPRKEGDGIRLVINPVRHRG